MTRDRLNQKMYMIASGTDLQEYQVIPLADLQSDITKRLIYRRIYHDTEIFRNAYEMIQYYDYIVASVK